MCVAWALSYTAIDEPLVIFSCGNLLYIYNIQRKGISSYLRGHGGVRLSQPYGVGKNQNQKNPQQI